MSRIRVLVGTKKDMAAASFDAIDRTIPEGIATNLDLQGFIEVSAKTGEYVAEAFDLLLQAMLANRK